MMICLFSLSMHNDLDQQEKQDDKQKETNENVVYDEMLHKFIDMDIGTSLANGKVC